MLANVSSAAIAKSGQETIHGVLPAFTSARKTSPELIPGFGSGALGGQLNALSNFANVAFGAWFIGTLVVQLPFSFPKKLRRFDPTSHLLPGWNFFSPKPIMADIDLMFRWVPAADSLGRPTGWVRAEPPQGRQIRGIVFNPRRSQKSYLSVLPSNSLGSARH